MIVLVMQDITAKVAQIMTGEFTWDNLAGESFQPDASVDCSIVLTQTVSDTSKVQITIQEAKGAQSSKKILLWREMLPV